MNGSAFKELEDAFAHAAVMDPQSRDRFVEDLKSRSPCVAEDLAAMLQADEASFDGAVRATMLRAGAPQASGTIGHYRLLGPLGEGGFGTVYLAEQPAPLRRLVAIKILKPGMDSHVTLARFNDERQALALMNHRSVVSAIDAGIAPDGRPYVVMPLVPGLPITAFADERAASVAERARLLLEVCRGVQHAHARGVIHRDLKPGNILVSQPAEGEPAEPRIIDFGLAKALASPLTSHATLTLAGQIIGTPEYMSPEQAAQSPPDVRSDVYALGAILFELLAGEPPIAPEHFRGCGPLRVEELIRTHQPTPPSRRAAATGRPGVPLELDWICLRCLEKEPPRRYATVNALADDLERFLAGREVVAGPPARVYRLRKWIRQRFVLVLGVSISTLGVVVGLIVALLALNQSRADQHAARQIAETLKAAILTIDPRTAQGRDTSLLREQFAVLRQRVEQSRLDPMPELEISEALALAYASIGESNLAVTFANRAIELAAREEGRDSPRILPLLRILSDYDGDRLEPDETRRQQWRDNLRDEMRRLTVLRFGPGSEEFYHTELAYVRKVAPQMDAILSLLAAAERDLPRGNPVLLGIQRRAAATLADHGDRRAADLLERARTDALLVHGPESPLVYEGIVGEYRSLRAAQPRAAALQEFLPRLAAAERILGAVHPVVVRAGYNLAEDQRNQGEATAALDQLCDVYQREASARGNGSVMARWIDGSIALAALQSNAWDHYLQAEARIRAFAHLPFWTDESIADAVVRALAERGESARAREWLSGMERHRQPSAAILRGQLDRDGPNGAENR